MAIAKVWIVDGCIKTRLCEETAPEVFRVEDVATVLEGVNFADYTEEIKDAADSCPVEVIKYSE